MASDASARRATLRRFDALLFDLDGVITKTAAVHARAWKALFDEFLRRWSDEHGEPFRPFEIAADYVAYVDGRRRYDGVASFLGSRGIELPGATLPTDLMSQRCAGSATARTATSSPRSRLRASRCSTTPSRSSTPPGPPASRSRSCRPARTATRSCARSACSTGSTCRVTGIEATAWTLTGKPAPDTFLKAAELLGVAARAGRRARGRHLRRAGGPGRRLRTRRRRRP